MGPNGRRKKENTYCPMLGSTYERMYVRPYKFGITYEHMNAGMCAFFPGCPTSALLPPAL